MIRRFKSKLLTDGTDLLKEYEAPLRPAGFSGGWFPRLPTVEYVRATCDWCGKVQVLDRPETKGEPTDDQTFLIFRDKCGWVGHITHSERPRSERSLMHFCTRRCRAEYVDRDTEERQSTTPP